MMMKLQRYDFELNYTPGKYIELADALSRALLPSTGTQIIDMPPEPWQKVGNYLFRLNDKNYLVVIDYY